MKPEPFKPEQYLYLKESGIDIDTCKLEFKKISVRCEDLNLYKKAFRVKIRFLIKQNSMTELKVYVNAFYTLAHFVRFIYGFHSCGTKVEAWQEILAYELQKKFLISEVPPYTGGAWIEYKSVDIYKAFFAQIYKDLPLSKELDLSECIQDKKPFLNPKDRAHFDKCLEMKERR